MKSLVFSLLLGMAFAQMPVIPLPNPLPTMGYAGATFTDPAYGTTITQCTDQNTDATNKQHYSAEVTGTMSANQWVWSLDGTLLAFDRADSGTVGLVSWNGSSCSGMIPGTIMDAGATASHVAPKKFYYLKGTQIWSLDMASGSPVTAQVGDFQNGLPQPNGGKWTWSAPVTTIDGDEAFFGAFGDRGGQDTAEYAVGWVPASNIYHLWNTLAVTMDGKPLTGVNSFTIHDMFAYPGGWIQVADVCPSCPAVHGPYMWLAGTTNITLAANLGAGHNTNGHFTFLNLTSSPKIASHYDFSLNQYTFITSNTGISFPPGDTHLGWQDDDPLDLNPFFASEMSIAENGSNVPVPIVAPLQDEIWLVNPATGVITREGHCFSSGVANAFNARTEYCIAAISPDGKYIAFSSDWMGTLGNTVNLGSAPSLLQKLLGNFRPTPQPCTLGAKKPGECQSQVFILKVK